MIKNVIEIKKLKKSYRGKMVLQNIGFSVKKGSIHGFIGPNGAGKTTTLTIMGVVIFLTLFTFSLALKGFQKEDLN